jgi:hypothetical protein
MAQKGADHRVPPASPGVVETHQDRSRREVRSHRSAYPQPRPPGSVLSELLPLGSLPDRSNAHRRLDRLPRPTHPPRGLAGHRAGRQTTSRHRRCRLPLRGLGVGRPGHRPGDVDPHPLDPQRRGRDRGRRHPRPPARRPGRLRRHLPRRGALLPAAQDPAVRTELGRAGDRRVGAAATRPLLLSAGVLAARPHDGAGRRPDPAPGRRDAGANAGRGQSRPGFRAGWRQRLRPQRRGCGVGRRTSR